MSAKLTKPQMELLRECNVLDGTTCVDTYRPAQILVERGLAYWTPLATRLRITDAGRALLDGISP